MSILDYNSVFIETRISAILLNLCIMIIIMMMIIIIMHMYVYVYIYIYIWSRSAQRRVGASRSSSRRSASGWIGTTMGYMHICVYVYVYVFVCIYIYIYIYIYTSISIYIYIYIYMYLPSPTSKAHCWEGRMIRLETLIEIHSLSFHLTRCQNVDMCFRVLRYMWNVP